MNDRKRSSSLYGTFVSAGRQDVQYHLYGEYADNILHNHQCPQMNGRSGKLERGSPTDIHFQDLLEVQPNRA